MDRQFQPIFVPFSWKKKHVNELKIPAGHSHKNLNELPPVLDCDTDREDLSSRPRLKSFSESEQF